MAESTGNDPIPLELPVQLSLGSPLDLDVAYCDIVHARNPNPDGPFELRFRGTRQPDGKAVRLFVPLEHVEGGLIIAGVITGHVDTSQVPTRAEGHPRALPLLRHALTLRKGRRGNGKFFVDVVVRDESAAVTLEQYLQDLHTSAEKLAPALQKHGFVLGAAEVITMAGELRARRIAERGNTDAGNAGSSNGGGK